VHDEIEHITCVMLDLEVVLTVLTGVCVERKRGRYGARTAR